MVVVVIVGIISAIALLSIGIIGDDRQLQQQGRRLSTLIELAVDEAQMQGRDYGLEFMRSGYRFLEHDPIVDQWNEITGDDFLRQRELDEALEFELFLEERRIELQEAAAQTERDEDESDRDLTDDYLPHVLILSSGDISPFNIRIVRFIDRAAVTLGMSETGEIEVTTDDQADF